MKYIYYVIIINNVFNLNLIWSLFQTRTYVHVFDQCTQNWFSVLSIIEHTLNAVHQTKPEVTEAFFSDQIMQTIIIVGS